MKTRYLYLLAIAGFCALPVVAHAVVQGTAFTYQGRLNDTAGPANGTYDLKFAVFDGTVTGTQQGNSFTNYSTSISNGLFTVMLDFGDQFPGASRWLEISVRTNNAVNFTTLAPRQELTPVPYAINARNVVGPINGSSITAGTIGSAQLATNVGFWMSAGTNLGYYSGNVAINVAVPKARLQVAGTIISGSPLNSIVPGILASTIAGGGNGNSNSIASENSFIGAGASNSIALYATSSFIGSGTGNVIQTNAATSVIVGGYANSVSSSWGFVGGGAGNSTSGLYATIAGGGLNLSAGSFGFVGGGYGNSASGSGAMVPGGYYNQATGTSSFAAGSSAHSLHESTFVWNDNSGPTFASTGPNQFLIRATGGVGIGTPSPAAPLHVAGSGETFVIGGNPHAGGFTALSAGISAASSGYAWLQSIRASGSTYGDLILNGFGGNVGIGKSNPGSLLDVNGNITCFSLSQTSDRDAKQDFVPITPTDILVKVAALPLSEWSYKQENHTRHIGPMAQDFYTAFKVGPDEKHITTIDESGVALAAIQGLNQKLEAALKQKDARLEELENRLTRLEKLLHQ